jgi:ABC-2 type transport system ATP-binding protein
VSMICFEGISKSFAGRPVLDHLSFSVDRGQVYGLLGPNGCGKSTAINILCNLLEPDAGTVRIGHKGLGETAGLLGYCPQEIALYRDLCPAENLRFFAQVYGVSSPNRERRVAELMQLFGLEPYARTPVGSLSGGWQRRVSIAIALIHEPEVVVLDEPTAAVDLEARYELWHLIEMLRCTGATILLTTHHLDEAERLCSRIGIMKNGRVAKEGSVSELLAIVPGRMVATVDTADEDAVSLRAAELGWGVRHYAGKLACLLPHEVSLKTVVDAFTGIDVSTVSLQRVSLEHAFLEVVHQGSHTGTNTRERTAMSQNKALHTDGP